MDLPVQPAVQRGSERQALGLVSGMISNHAAGRPADIGAVDGAPCEPVTVSASGWSLRVSERG